MSAICGRLRSEGADFCALTEYRSKPGTSLRDHFVDHHLAVTQPPLNQNGILAYSRDRLVAVESPKRAVPKSSHRWLATHLEKADILALSIHIPNQNERWNKDDFWKHVCRFAKRHRDDRAMILGDFNTGLDADTENEKFLHSPQFQKLLDLGWIDCYRAVHGERREYSWYSPNGNNGYRLDHVFLSASLKSKLAGARFDHDVRTSRLSDHSLFTVDLTD